MMPQQVLLVAARRCELCGFRFAPAGCTPIAPSRGQHLRRNRVLGEIVEDHPMVGGIEQPPLLELALDLDEAVAQLAQKPNARRLIINKGTAAPIGTDQASQHDRLAVSLEPGFTQNCMSGMVSSDRKFGCHRRLLRSRSNEPSLCPFPKRQPQSIEQDRFAGARFARQHAQTRSKGELEAIDENNVPDIQPKQH
jgi:hypothetical protein